MTKGSERNYILKILEDIDKKDLFVNQIIDDYFYVYDFDKQQRSFISKVVYGVVEQRLYLDFAINQFSKVKVNKMKPTIRHIMRMTVYQILFMDKVPAHAAINEAVKLAKKRKFYQLTGFVNGVLRSVEREKDSVAVKVEKLPAVEGLSVKYSFDKDLLVYLMKQYDTDTIEAFLKVSLNTKGTTIRTNTLKINTNDLKDKLEKSGTVLNSHLLTDSLHVSEYGKLDLLPGFAEGEFQVQDESSSLVGLIAGVKETDTVLDACASPGGKTTHMAQLMGNKGKVVSCDVSESKIARILDNVERLSLKNVEIAIGDARESNTEFIDSFDVVVADVPCSGLGIIRNKPDIKYNMTPKKIQSLIELQHVIINNLKTYVKPGGTFVYSTCTVNKNENIKQVMKFLADNDEFSLVDINEVIMNASGIDDPQVLKPFIHEGCLQLMTSDSLTDGFFIAKLVRNDR